MSKRLYRDPVEGKLGGVCAGIAHYLGIDIWVVRLITLLVFALGGTVIVLLLYGIACLTLEKQPVMMQGQSGAPYSPERQTPSALLAQLEQDIQGLDARLQRMETHVTSSSFEVERAFRQL